MSQAYSPLKQTHVPRWEWGGLPGWQAVTGFRPGRLCRQVVAPEPAGSLDKMQNSLPSGSASVIRPQALVLTRQYPAYVPAVEIAAEAAAMAGDPAEAFRILDRAGRARGEESLRVQAMFLAADAGLDEQAQRVAVTPTAHGAQVSLSWGF